MKKYILDLTVTENVELHANYALLKLTSSSVLPEMLPVALLFVYFFFTIEAPEDSGLIAFGNALAGVGYFDLMRRIFIRTSLFVSHRTKTLRHP